MTFNPRAYSKDTAIPLLIPTKIYSIQRPLANKKKHIRYNLIADSHLPNDRLLEILDTKTSHIGEIKLTDAYNNNDFLNQIGAEDIRRITLMWTDLTILEEKEKMKQVK